MKHGTIEDEKIQGPPLSRIHTQGYGLLRRSVHL